ncbi:hypothetical protein CXF96_12810 [Stenotrophomonas sp. Betaine-02u-21]|jgi:hypothetical protein|uniref:hypothetical protein n=1 Tax=unclassified Stenotrophomonas TaxID=196198 RepID=UPI000C345092|nr:MULTISPECIES: hypothetical protein [unclassified Stenotrophomonas]PKH71554.1 hypothetical protein CXF90_10620 [Stenotrophomonas sp. Betaine-02u-23]PKH73247.1 hypothetical protein CXF96_12810 [Stenotrophomonas sp. Betaine-02u-21]PKH95845.1 hypothetical protein CXG43_11500 [Stenotrophomonas sp. Bg11-02]
MSLDPWAALAARRQRRQWRHWPWGWTALGLSLAAWASVFMLAFLVLASVGMPGDGDHALRATRIPLLITLCIGVLVTLGCLVASVLSLRLPQRPAAGIAALALLALLVACLLLPRLF